MIRILAVIALIFTYSFSSNFLELTQKERTDAVNYLKETQKNLEKELKGLSENQLKWKPADSVWSIAECVEHIALSEKNLFELTMGSLKSEADPSKRSQLKMDDESIKNLITDRSFKVKTKEGFIPTGQFGDAWKTLDVFKERRAKVIGYVKDTKDDLRNHFTELPFGLVDSYQMLLFLSGHTLRHTKQITEVKATPGFPKQ